MILNVELASESYQSRTSYPVDQEAKLTSYKVGSKALTTWVHNYNSAVLINKCLCSSHRAMCLETSVLKQSNLCLRDSDKWKCSISNQALQHQQSDLGQSFVLKD